MRKPFRWDKKYLYWGVTAFLVIVGSILFFLIASRLALIGAALRTVVGALSPILYGLVFAYLFNKLMSLLETRLLLRAGQRFYPKNTVRARSFSRVTSIILTILIILAIIGGTLALVIPQIYASIQGLLGRLPAYYKSVVEWSKTVLTANSDLENAVAKIFGNITEMLTSWLTTTVNTKELFTDLTTGVVNVLKEIGSILIGFIVAIYVLGNKEKFGAQCKRMVFGFFKPSRANRILHNIRFLDKTVGGFILGKIIESIIVGLVSYIVLMLLGMPYSVLIAVFLMVTNLIPFFGVFIGAVPSALMIVLEDPIKCLIFIVYVIVLHTIANNFLAPRVQSETIGLGGFWVLFAILLFGGLFGFWGLLLGVPVFAVIYAAVSALNRRQLREKNFPVTTAEYETILEIDPETGVPVMIRDECGGKKARKDNHDQDTEIDNK